MAREYACRILELMDEGALDPAKLAENLLRWMSEADVRQYYETFLEEEDEEEDYPDPDAAYEDKFEVDFN
jgi:hypothetical protein